MTPLQQVREEIIRRVWSIQQMMESPLTRNVDLVIDPTCDMIDIVVDGCAHPLVTRKEIEDETYKDLFEQRVRDVLGGKFGAPLVTR